MSNRHIARSVVLQVLFERDTSPYALTLEQCYEHIELYGKEFGTRANDMDFMRELIQMTIAKQKEIDEVIIKAAPEWPLDQISPIDRNVLRIGLCELLYADRTQVPAKVAINESIELAKAFGGSTSSRFVNGVLGAVYVEMGEPGKYEGSSRKSLLSGDMLVEELAGAVVYAKSGGETYLAFVHDIFGHWTISKGKINPGESTDACAQREIKEEMGIDITIRSQIGVNEYIANDSRVEGGKKKKRVTYFLAEAQFTELRLGKSGGLDDCQWFPSQSIGALNFYDDTLKIIMSGMEAISKQN